MKMKFVLLPFFAAMLLAAPMLVHASPGQPGPRRIDVTAKRFAFTPGEITLKKGEPVVLTLHSVDVPHGIRFRELGIEAKAVKGRPADLAFTPEKTGTFIGHCSVFCGSGHGTMTLTLHIVE